MKRRISFRPYRRDFVRPLRTAHGVWAVREGFIVRVEEGGHVGYGEVAPIPDFGTETAAEAKAFLEALAVDPLMDVPNDLPCCAFAVSAALKMGLRKDDLKTGLPAFRVAALLPASEAAVSVAGAKVKAGYRTLKWKAGVLPLSEEREICASLIRTLPKGAKLRLDFNGALTRATCEEWLSFLSDYADTVELIEQPLPVGEEKEMAELAADAVVPIALDESLNGVDGRIWLEPEAWGGPLVIKPALMGNVEALAQTLAPVASRIVWSSSFESPVGLRNAVQLMCALPYSPYAIGFDTLGAFSDELSVFGPNPEMDAGEVDSVHLDELWERLG